MKQNILRVVHYTENCTRIYVLKTFLVTISNKKIYIIFVPLCEREIKILDQIKNIVVDRKMILKVKINVKLLLTLGLLTTPQQLYRSFFSSSYRVGT